MGVHKIPDYFSITWYALGRGWNPTPYDDEYFSLILTDTSGEIDFITEEKMGHYDECRHGFCSVCGQAVGHCKHTNPTLVASGSGGPPFTESSEQKVYCRDCVHFRRPDGLRIEDGVCDSPYNIEDVDTWYEPDHWHRNSPQVINGENDCTLFTSKPYQEDEFASYRGFVPNINS
jgi:hypothetical protein